MHSVLTLTLPCTGGVGCGDGGYPGLYVNVSHHLAWLDTVVHSVVSDDDTGV